MWANITQFFAGLFEKIGGFFKGLFGIKDNTPAAATLPAGEAAPAQAPGVAIAQEAAPLVDEKTKATIAALVAKVQNKDSHYIGLNVAPEDLQDYLRRSINAQDKTIGTSENPILTQSSAGQLVVNLPKNAQAGFRLAEGEDKKGIAILTVMPSIGELGNTEQRPASFTGQSYEIPVSLLQKFQIVFNAPKEGSNYIGVESGLASKAASFVVMSKGAQVETRGADAFINGQLQTGKANIKKGLITEDMETLIAFNADYRDNKEYRTAAAAAYARREAAEEALADAKDTQNNSESRSTTTIYQESAFPAGGWRAKPGGNFQGSALQGQRVRRGGNFQGSLIGGGSSVKAEEVDDPHSSKTPINGLPNLVDKDKTV